MKSPASPTAEQVEALNRETALGDAEHLMLKNGSLTLDLDANALLLVKIAGEGQTLIMSYPSCLCDDIS